ncbi:thioredoxin family protein [Sulfurovum sp.]|uniref:thioredoxin family protein n=1 Tax=Sulfurovum sp. TaxID=1969726 RepID=UPI003562D991
MKLKKIFLLVFFTNIILSASTMYTLSGINKLYLVVEISGKTVPPSYRSTILESLQAMTDELKIDTKGYDPRSLAVLVNEMKVNDTTVINIQLLIGEEVQRLDNNEKTFALTYQSMGHFLFNEGDDIEDAFEDTFDTMLSKFSEQYTEENKKITKVVIDEKNFASEMKYETNYEEAVKKSKKLHKNIMLVLVSNYCPWCRKFEQRVLLKNEVNELIQKNYIPLILNREKDPFPKEFDTGFTPIVHFIDYKTLKSYKNVIGYNNKDEFTYILKTDTLTK